MDKIDPEHNFLIPRRLEWPPLPMPGEFAKDGDIWKIAKNCFNKMEEWNWWR